MCGGFSIWRSAHFNLVVRRKRFELVFHADTDIHCTRRVEYSLLRVLDTRPRQTAVSLSVAFPIDLEAAIASCASRLKFLCAFSDFLARFSFVWRVFLAFFFACFLFFFFLCCGPSHNSHVAGPEPFRATLFTLRLNRKAANREKQKQQKRNKQQQKQ